MGTRLTLHKKYICEWPISVGKDAPQTKPKTLNIASSLFVSSRMDKRNNLTPPNVGKTDLNSHSSLVGVFQVLWKTVQSFL